mmetsp:Transcript_14427/g.22387  ORF Transcript_14427/g.22387 Transcript_14427/m.22387 type:complete len:175 (-) Transcript_14427:65-589(-)|eukprot:CAMPEP_0184307148 /NCGR_PEP_ID=MMETSP1049-20130417/15968_1 /TAXON_ID=77928 /ORGANISM="Proteomonas sulcata, Strain CCMP704" /LENGTH=174 /DNA_ID=CAMNT_0026619567 /DNA_START=73 /DNA_END=597 /DNA_ORIENTATION=+
MNWKLALALVLSILCLALAADMTKYYKRTGQKYLDEKAKEEGIIKLPSGMLYKVLKEESSGKKVKSPTQADRTKVTYSGKLKDGTPFDSGTTSFAPSQVIKGWTEALQLMCEGEKWELHIPYDMAYGERGSPPKIPPYNPLVFEVEIHKVESGGKPCKEAKEELQKKLQAAKEL